MTNPQNSNRSPKTRRKRVHILRPGSDKEAYMWTKGIVLVVTTVVITGWMRLWSTVADAQAPACLVATMHGDVRGIDRGQSCEFRAIPFALSTAGAGRWK